MAHAAKKLTVVAGTDTIDVSRARLVRRGPGRDARLSLRALREAAGLTQEQVAKASGLRQPDVSKLETASSLDDRVVLTLRRYLSALGDDLELVALSKHGHRIGVAGAVDVRPNGSSEYEHERRLAMLLATNIAGMAGDLADPKLDAKLKRAIAAEVRRIDGLWFSNAKDTPAARRRALFQSLEEAWWIAKRQQIADANARLEYAVETARSLLLGRIPVAKVDSDVLRNAVKFFDGEAHGKIKALRALAASLGCDVTNLGPALNNWTHERRSKV
jgi:transcriptional regulator with XRE-family HTH domain